MIGRNRDDKDSEADYRANTDEVSKIQFDKMARIARWSPPPRWASPTSITHPHATTRVRARGG
jgi:hypothetical protein